MKIKFTKEQIKNMIESKKLGASNQAIANRYGCSEATIREQLKIILLVKLQKSKMKRKKTKWKMYSVNR